MQGTWRYEPFWLREEAQHSGEEEACDAGSELREDERKTGL